MKEWMHGINEVMHDEWIPINGQVVHLFAEGNNKHKYMVKTGKHTSTYIYRYIYIYIYTSQKKFCTQLWFDKYLKYAWTYGLVFGTVGERNHICTCAPIVNEIEWTMLISQHI